jgi:deoxyribonuclease V
MSHKSVRVKPSASTARRGGRPFSPCSLSVVINPGNRYNLNVKARRIHAWDVTTAEARGIQESLRGDVVRHGGDAIPTFVAGADISFQGSQSARAAVVVLRFPEMELIEARVEEDVPRFPYVPGLLTFREAPLLLRLFEELETDPDLIMIDGQGIAHPRRLGLAAHIGILLGAPTIGCAKSRLCGEFAEPELERGACSPLYDHGEVIGAVVRTRNGVKPVFVSIGHMIDLATSVKRVLECCRGYRIPEPTRMAHLAAGGNPTSCRTVRGAAR